jgi:hypothetical protein
MRKIRWLGVLSASAVGVVTGIVFTMFSLLSEHIRSSSVIGLRPFLAVGLAILAGWVWFGYICDLRKEAE